MPLAALWPDFRRISENECGWHQEKAKAQENFETNDNFRHSA